MPPTFTAVFAEHLAGRLGVRAREPRDGEILSPGTIYVAPGGRHMGLRSVSEIRLEDGPPVNYCRPAVDVLFKDAATFFGASAIGVVLTGMGSDGTEGARALVRAGASVIAQDEATSTIWGMPGSIVRAGLAKCVLPLAAIGPSLKNHIIGALA
jgi:two-component system chemotaxis response regulator CheB